MRISVVPYRFFSKAWPWELVVDVGSGDNPHPRADVLVDIAGASEDRWGPLQEKQKVLIIADAHFLPFSDRSFDIAICAHCLEHCANPEIVAQELSRIARKGIVEVPTPYLEVLLQPYERHQWIFARHGSYLLYAPMPCIQLPITTSRQTVALLRSNTLFRNAYLFDNDIFHTRYHWNDNLMLRRTSQEEVLALQSASTNLGIGRSLGLAAQYAFSRWADVMVAALRRIRYFR